MGSSEDERPWARLQDDVAPLRDDGGADAIAMFDAQVRERPDAVALRYFDTPWTFAEVDAQARALAAALAAGGVGRGERVVVYLQNCPPAVLALLAAWRLGAVVVAASALSRAKELTYLLEDCTPAAVLASDALWAAVGAELALPPSVRTVVVTAERDLGGGGPAPVDVPGTVRLTDLLAAHAGAPAADAGRAAGDVALLVYTSGTTGPPKGAMCTHANVAFSARTYRDGARVGPHDVILGLAPLFHVTGLIGHSALMMASGAELLLAARFEAGTVLGLIERHRPTFTVGAITAFRALLQHERFAATDVSSLRTVYSGGAPVAPAVAAEFEAHFGVPVRGVYGLTETTSPSHMEPLGHRGPVDPGTGALSVGLPVPGTMAWIIGEDDRPCAPGVPGEIVIAGPQVVAGYWNKPEETRRAIPGGRLRTGDVGVMDADGWFFVVDRLKDQINVSGYKVWPREVEDVLLSHPGVREAAVVGVPDDYRGEAVHAVVVRRPGAAVDAAALQAFCRERMAAYKAPRTVAFTDELPKTASGKVLRRELRPPA